MGALTLAGLALARDGRDEQARRLWFVGGGLMAVLAAASVAYIIQAFAQIASTGAPVLVSGPEAVPLVVRLIVLYTVFNAPLQWALALLAGAFWIHRPAVRANATFKPAS